VVELTAWSQLDARTKPHDFAMAVSFQQPARRGLECVAQMAKTTARGDEVELKAGVVARIADNAVLIGAPGAVKRAAERLRSRTAQPPDFARRALAENSQAALLIGAELTTMPDRVPLRAGVVSLTSDPSHFALVTRLTLASAKHAQQFARQLDAKKLAAAVEQAQGDASVLPKARVSQRGAEVVSELRVDGDMEAQTAAVGALAAVAIHGVRRYLARSKEAQAKSTLRTIALSVAAYVERQPPAKRRLPPSAPRTPKQVPAGERSMLTAQSFAHPTWKAIGFSLEGPHYYSYEIVTAPGGRQAAIIATGDLDGDGEFSRYRLELKLDARGNLNMAQQLSVERELE
jgi:hypothetical protein